LWSSLLEVETPFRDFHFHASFRRVFFVVAVAFLVSDERFGTSYKLTRGGA
jgi:hypothetical protein